MDLPKGSENDRHCCRVLVSDVFARRCALRPKNVRKGEEWYKRPVERSWMCYVQWLLGGRDSAESCEMIDESGKEKARKARQAKRKTRSRKRSCEKQFSSPFLVAPEGRTDF